jgi:hypothetical protein
MLATMPNCFMPAKYSANCAQSATKGMCPASGKALTAVRREDWNEVSSPW